MFRDTGASRTGLGAWWWQRLTAVYLALFLVVALGWLGMRPPEDFTQWRAWLAGDGVRVALALFIAAAAVHAYIGVRDVMMDYVPAGTVRTLAFGVWTLLVAAFGSWGLLWVVRL